MFAEYIVYLVVPIWLGFIGEVYKDISTKSYALILIATVCVLKIYWMIVDNSAFIEDLEDINFMVCFVGIGSGFFWLQKYLRRDKPKI